MLITDSMFSKDSDSNYKITLLNSENNSVTIDNSSSFVVLQSGATRRGMLLIVLLDTKDNNKTIPLVFQNKIDYDDCLFVLYGDDSDNNV